jgi:hypothetical protein
LPPMNEFQIEAYETAVFAHAFLLSSDATATALSRDLANLPQLRRVSMRMGPMFRPFGRPVPSERRRMRTMHTGRWALLCCGHRRGSAVTITAIAYAHHRGALPVQKSCGTTVLFLRRNGRDLPRVDETSNAACRVKQRSRSRHKRIRTACCQTQASHFGV